MDAPASPTRPRSAPSTPATGLAEWLRGSTDVAVHGDLAVAVSGISLSTARIQPGDLYAALPGARAHGADFAAQALAAGAVGVLTDPAGLDRLPPDTPAIVVPEPRRVLGHLAAHLYGEPATALRVIGVTGTQGKTTTTRVLEQGLTASGVTSAVIGTVGTRIAGEAVRTQLTTPEAPDLHGLFAVMRERGVDTCAMEVSSHALVLGRVDGVVFDVATFLNLGRDHLDFHADLDEYFAAKASLFTPERARVGLTNVDDEFGRRLLDVSSVPMSTYSSRGQDADWRAVDVELSPTGATFTVLGPGVEVPAAVNIPGEFNVSNALAAIASAALAGLDPAQVADGIAQVGGVPGRLEQVSEGQDYSVVVDYAHKPDALEAVLATLRPLTRGRVVVVVGAGGDRDTLKRPVMGEIAARLADLVIVTDDNPRTENPAAIRAAVLEGARGGSAEVLEVGDRRLAIREAVLRAEPGDVVLIAGKGHETGQEVHGEVHPFDDRVVAGEEILGRGDVRR
ncbi:UDP-N-acetylmuramoyl-L-alanyl-D-glutamate--2,6-diaminopimelate ligase [Microbacterium sp. ARD31]|uniref:UDP-N-acetylmuramoyl-L-alanyl-D-glutamate--2, 6-diaminopimelate ligase n=1 Tax=Microbacterium sp. ARD31 TaxID=2962576 RepID=UPI002882AFCD|nr:UDP-N-acetylmuramoyl-L-alanyl-D-glutamate--2,6-diaminopimelate ligase [Microbacterium sp. ARD31]MDT0185479.1 UDP-N-acetylmuramoyl-L-alanyl-D-glutamate--2,6-diaminopimelate ligase [Microbacterium sp. ARD31]